MGDALGTTVEFSSAARIASRRPDAWPKELIGEGPFQLVPGQITDDTELALSLARSLVKQGRYDPEDAAAAYARWRRSDPFDCGMATARAETPTPTRRSQARCWARRWVKRPFHFDGGRRCATVCRNARWSTAALICPSSLKRS